MAILAFGIAEKIANDGYMNTYYVNSKFGTFTATSTAMLKKRIDEINALALIENIEKTKEYATAVKNATTGRFRFHSPKKRGDGFSTPTPDARKF